MSSVLMEDKLLDFAGIRQLVPISKTSMWRWRKAGAFPVPVRLGSRRVAWRASDIAKWIAERPALTDAPEIKEGG